MRWRRADRSSAEALCTMHVWRTKRGFEQVCTHRETRLRQVKPSAKRHSSPSRYLQQLREHCVIRRTPTIGGGMSRSTSKPYGRRLSGDRTGFMRSYEQRAMRLRASSGLTQPTKIQFGLTADRYVARRWNDRLVFATIAMTFGSEWKFPRDHALRRCRIACGNVASDEVHPARNRVLNEAPKPTCTRERVTS